MKPLVIGIGNPFRGDDAAGLVALDRLKNAYGNQLDYLQVTDNLLPILDHWKGRDLVFIVDAMYATDFPSGGVVSFELPKEDLREVKRRYSTHGISLIDFLLLAETIEEMPPHLHFIGINGSNWTPGNPVCPAVSRSVDRLVKKFSRFVTKKQTKAATMT